MQMQQRVLGRTGLRVSAIGFGAWAIGGSWGPQEDATSLAALRRYAELGGNFIDTALAYGQGHSERLIGQFLREAGERERFVIATKIPPLRPPGDPAIRMTEAFPAEHLRASVEQSLTNLKLDTLDLVQLHTWAGAWSGETEWLDVLGQLRDEGKLRFFGVSVVSYRETEFLPVVQAGRVDTIQVRFNLLDQAPRQLLFDAARDQGVGVIARTPLGSGTLTGRMTRGTVFPEGDWRAGWLTGQKLELLMEHLEQLAFLTEGRTWPEAALQFVLAHPEVATAIPGIRSPEQAEQNVRTLESRPLTVEELQLAHRLYAERFGRDAITLWR